jgi:hypothetical protein
VKIRLRGLQAIKDEARNYKVPINERGISMTMLFRVWDGVRFVFWFGLFLAHCVFIGDVEWVTFAWLGICLGRYFLE